MSADVIVPSQVPEQACEVQSIPVSSEFDQFFTLEGLINNPYLAYNMNQNLQMPLSVVFDERSVKAISENKSVILEALKKSPRVTVYDDQLIVNLQQTRLKVVVSNIRQGDQTDFRNFLKNQPHIATNDADISFDEQNQCHLQFKEQERAEQFLQWTRDPTTLFKNQQVKAIHEHENIYLSIIDNIKGSKNSSFYPSSQTLPTKFQPIPQPVPLMQPIPPYLPPQFAIQYPLPTQPFLSDCSDLLIRKARDDQQNQQQQQQQQRAHATVQQVGRALKQPYFVNGTTPGLYAPVDPFMAAAAFQQQLYMMQYYPMFGGIPPFTPMPGYGFPPMQGQVPFMQQQQQQQRNHEPSKRERRRHNNQNNYSNNNSQAGPVNTSNTNTERSGRRHRRNQNGNGERQQQSRSNRRRDNSGGERNNSRRHRDNVANNSRQQVVKKSPRIDAENFPALHPETEKKDTVIVKEVRFKERDEEEIKFQGDVPQKAEKRQQYKIVYERTEPKVVPEQNVQTEAKREDLNVAIVVQAIDKKEEAKQKEEESKNLEQQKRGEEEEEEEKKEVPQIERTTFDHVYTRLEIMKVFDSIKQSPILVEIPTALMQLRDKIPVIQQETIPQLEMVRPTRKNSSMTPLLQPLQGRRKGSWNYNNNSNQQSQSLPKSQHSTSQNRKYSEKM